MDKELSKFRAGDKVTLAGRVVSLVPGNPTAVTSDYLAIKIFGGQSTPQYFRPLFIETHIPAHPKVGDMVKDRHAPGVAQIGPVVAVDGEEAWIRWSVDGLKTALLDDLERIT